jgi:magnesium chelatase family protein
MGVLFLDELTEFSRSHLDQLREPLETGNITITRANNTMTYPASFIFVGACNPCPCGYRGDSQRHCVCGEGLARRYWAKVSGPLLDRIDLQVAVRRLSEAELKAVRGQESSQSIRLRVRRAAEMQQSRFPDGKVVYNAQLNRRQVEQICRLDSHGREHLVNLVYKFGLSARSYDRILKTARTIADLEGLENIEMPHLNEALRYRNLSYVFA